MLILKFKNRKGNSSIEYAFLIALVIGALIGMQAYLKRPICQRWRLAGDAFGFGRQYMSSVAPDIPPADLGGDEFSLVEGEGYEFIFPNAIDEFVRFKVNIPFGGGRMRLDIKEGEEGKLMMTLTQDFLIGGNGILIEGDTSSLSPGGPYYCDLYFNDVRIYKNFDKFDKVDKL